MTATAFRQRLKESMPSYMKEFESELKKVPNPVYLPGNKRDFITAWIRIFDSKMADDKLNIGYRIKAFSGFKTKHIEQSGVWTKRHYAEFDLGSGLWFPAMQRIATLLKTSRGQSITNTCS